MERPVSIIRFERCYLGSLLVGLMNTALLWNGMMERISAKLAGNPAVAPFGPAFVLASMAFGVVLVVITSLLLWFFVVRKPSIVVKWIVTMLFAYNLVTSLLRLTTSGTASGVPSAILVATALALNGLAVWQLFKPDARAWFGGVEA